jgi:hypothetical protein
VAYDDAVDEAKEPHYRDDEWDELPGRVQHVGTIDVVPQKNNLDRCNSPNEKRYIDEKERILKAP